jgi:SET domain-containing protein
MYRDPPFLVRRSKIQGRGAFATRAIKRGARIIEYTGERITHAEADVRYDDLAMRHHHTMLFSLDDVYCIDAAREGNDARYINHSCEPNCEAIQEGDRVFIFALRNIKEGEELTYDYRYEFDHTMRWSVARRIYPCHCGAPSCRGTIVSLPRFAAPGIAQRVKQGRKAS